MKNSFFELQNFHFVTNKILKREYFYHYLQKCRKPVSKYPKKCFLRMTIPTLTTGVLTKVKFFKFIFLKNLKIL